VFNKIREDYHAFAARLDLPDVHFLPISALKGDNVVTASPSTPWYVGNTLMNLLETVYIGSDRNFEDFRFPVQTVVRPNLNFRGFAGTIASGILRQGDEVMALPSRKTSRVKSIVTFDGDLAEAFTPQSVTVTLEDEIDVSRGDMLVRPGNVPQVGQKFEAMVVWMAEEALVPGKSYWIKQTTKLTPGTITTLRYRVDVNSMHRQDAPTLKLNEIGRCTLSTSQPMCFDSYRRNRNTGAFIVIDRVTNSTVGAGMILDRTSNEGRHDHWDDAPTAEHLHGEKSNVSALEREARFGQKPMTVLLTGLTGSGKTTLAYALERKLFDAGRAVVVLDGQNMRRGISKDLGFTADERSENLRRSAEVAKLFNDAGTIVLAAFVAPDEAIRQKAADCVGRERFLVVHLNAPLEVCRQRDTEGHYQLADKGEMTLFPGVTAPYEPPANPDLVLPTDKLAVNECVERILALLEAQGVLS
jgi:bifunctional enzyme CysN/CysC